MGKNGKQHRTRAQHFVPQLYLRGFIDSKGKLHCFDKVTYGVFATAPAKVAQQANFYEIAPGSTVVPIPDNAIENLFSRIESEMTPLLGRMIADADRGQLDHDLLSNFLNFVALQWMRTPTARAHNQEIANRSTQMLIDEMVKVNFGEDEKVRVSIPEDNLSALHAEFMLDPDLIQRIARSLDRLICVVGITDIITPLYTSDHPVVRRGNVMRDGHPMVGAGDPGIEYAYPLDSTHILLILERNHFKEWRKHDGKSVRLTPEQVRDYNGLQVKRSSRWVYSPVNDFDLAKQLCEENPVIRDPNRQRAVVEVTPIVLDKDGGRNYVFVTAIE